MNDAKTALGQKIVAAKTAKGWTWPQVAEKLGFSPVWTCAACLGQMSMSSETAEKAGLMFDLSPAEVALLMQAPYRGSLPTQVVDRPADLPVSGADQRLRHDVEGADPRGVR